MKTPNHLSSARRCFALVFALVALIPLRAQPSTPASAAPAAMEESYVLLTFVTVKPDRVTQYERLVKEELNPALKKGGVAQRWVSTRASVGEANVYVVGRLLKKLGELDQTPSPLVKALGQGGADALMEKLRACESALRTIVVRNIPGASWGLDEPLPMYTVSIFQLVNGKKAEWMKFQREVASPAYRQSGYRTYVVQETVYGGSSNQVAVLTRFDRFADLDGPSPLRQHLGEQGYEQYLAKRPIGAVADIERSLWRLRPELSITQPAKSKPTE